MIRRVLAVAAAVAAGAFAGLAWIVLKSDERTEQEARDGMVDCGRSLR